MQVNWIIFSVFLFSMTLLGSPNLNGQTDQELRMGFQHPPVSAFPKTYYWWLSGHVDTVRIKEEIRAMHEVGLSGFDIFDIGVPAHDTVVKAGAPFLGKESLGAIRVALKMAKELGMTAGLSMASSWNAGGSWIKPKHAAKSIYYSRTVWNGKKSLQLDFPKLEKTDPHGRIKNISLREDGRPVYYEDVAVLAIPSSSKKYIDPADVIDLSAFFDPKNETLTWDGEGEYEIFRYICSNSGEQLKLPSKLSAGPIIDHFDARATEVHFNYVIDKVKSILPGDIKQSALKSLYLASYEATGFTWTSTLPQAFKKINGYEILPYIPVLFDPDLFAPDVTKSFHSDFRRTLSEMMIENFYRTAKRICHAHGLKINSESGGPGFPLHNVPVEPLKSLGVMDLPRGEFWINHSRLNAEGIDILRVVKEVSAASHIYGRGMVEEEAFTTFQHWQEGPFEMKPSGDRAFCEGMNKVVIHGWSHNPRGYGKPGIVYGAGTHFNDRRIWWDQIRPFTEYLARISFLAQEGDFIADVLYYYGDAIPNYAGHKNSRFVVGPGYDYEVINTEILKQLTVNDGQVELPSGARFRILVLEPEEVMHPEVFQKVRQLVDSGAVILSEKPHAVSIRKNLPGLIYLEDDIESLWSNVSKEGRIEVSQNKVWAGISPVEVLEQLNTPPDFTYVDADFFKLDYIHYQIDDKEFYFIRNTTDQWLTRNCEFRQTGKRVEIWDPINGRIEPALIGHQKGSYYNVSVCLPPFGSTFVVFSTTQDPPEEQTTLLFINDPLSHPPYSIINGEVYIWEEGQFDVEIEGKRKTFANPIKEQILKGAWEIAFPQGWHAPEQNIFPELISWTDSEVEGIKYFSGTATYHKTFHYDIHSVVAPGSRVFLDLGDLTNVAEVRLNDTLLGITWAKPYKFDVTEVIRPGDNTLVVSVSNTWNNRLKGDAVTGQRLTHTNITSTNVAGLNKKRLSWAEVPLIKAGLLGPVTLLGLKPVALE